jgi:hypothetical protein
VQRIHRDHPRARRIRLRKAPGIQRAANRIRSAVRPT